MAPTSQEQPSRASDQSAAAPMSGSSPAVPSPGSPRPSSSREMPAASELQHIGIEALKIGALTGSVGAFAGAMNGIYRQSSPMIFGLVGGAQWFALGSTFMSSRMLLYHAWGGEENLKPFDKVKVSAIAGGVSGMASGLIRGPRNVIPGMLFWGAAAGTASSITQFFRAREPKQKTSWTASKWSPVTLLSDQEYIHKLEEKILRLDAEIAIIDDSIAHLRAQTSPSSENSSPASQNTKQGK